MAAQEPVSETIGKIANECSEAGASKWTVTKIIKQLSQIGTKNEKELRAAALDVLRRLDPKAAEVYASFQLMTVRTSAQTIEPFDRGNIIRSLLKETDVPRGVAEKIGSEVENKIKDLEVNEISTPLIREIVNVTLLEYGHEDVRNQYARLGLPLHEVATFIGQKPYSNRAIMAEYNLLGVIPKRLARRHLESEIHIANIEDFSTKLAALCINAEPLQDTKATILNSLGKARKLQAFVSWPVNISAINAAMACTVEKRKMNEAAELFALASGAVLGEKQAISRFIGTALFLPQHLEGKAVDRDVMVGLANKILQKENPAADYAAAIDTKYKLRLLDGKSLHRTVLLNCQQQELLPMNGMCSQMQAADIFIAINLPYVAMKSGNERNFMETLSGISSAARDIAELKAAQLAKRQYLRAIPESGKAVHALGLYGLLESAAAMLGSDDEKELLRFAEKVVNGALPESGWLLAEAKNPETLGRFAKANRKLMHEQAEKGKMEAQAKETKQQDENRLLAKSRGILKNYCFESLAENRKQLALLLDSGAKCAKLAEASQAE